MIRGYVTSRSFGGLCIPVPAQNSCLREIARSRSVAYCLPPLEHKFNNCYMQLFTVLRSANQGDVIAMYSVAMLPINNKRKMNEINSIIIEKSLTLLFALEGVECSSTSKISNIISSYILRDICSKQKKLDIRSIREQVVNFEKVH